MFYGLYRLLVHSLFKKLCLYALSLGGNVCLCLDLSDPQEQGFQTFSPYLLPYVQGSCWNSRNQPGEESGVLSGGDEMMELRIWGKEGPVNRE